MIFLITVKLMLDGPLKPMIQSVASMDCNVTLRGSFFNLILVETMSLNMNDPPEDDDDREEDAGAKEATSASIEPLVGHPRAIVAH